MRLVSKTLFDLFLSSILFILFLPLLIIFPFLIWYQDRSNPFYIANRVGKNGRLFKMIKFRTMIFNADKTGIDSTAINDNRITKLGHFIRRYKIDEIPGLINILKGEMSFVGPRPNVKRETDLYTNEEKILLNMKPGITDFSSIVFSDEIIPSGSYLSNFVSPWTELSIITFDSSDDISTCMLFSSNIPPLILEIEFKVPTGMLLLP